MTLLQSFLLGLLQGLTEFIPVSSSGHLVLLENYFALNLNESTLMAFDIILHTGTLLALILYFFKDFYLMIVNVFQEKTKGMLFKLIIATIPAGLAGFLLKDFIENNMRGTFSVAIMMFIMAITFLFAEKFPADKNKSFVSLKKAVYIGIAQIFALIPGISRSGSTISAGLSQGINRAEAARFSFLLGTPLIAGATILAGKDLFNGTVTFPDTNILIVGLITSFLSSLLCIKFLLAFLRKYSLKVFSAYLIILSLGVLVLEYIF